MSRRLFPSSTTIPALLLTGLCAAALSLSLGGCSDSHSWHAKNISGMMPDLKFTLHNDQGKPVTQADFDGIKLLYFGYTHCPDVCPATLARLALAVHKLPRADAARTRVLFVSVDPARDTPAQLARYTRSFGPEFIGLSGSQQQLHALTKRYRSTYGYGEKDAHGNYEVSHSSAVYVFDAHNKVRLLLHNDESASDIAADLEQLIRLDD